MHISFRCEWNDGGVRAGSDVGMLGWSGRCTLPTMTANVSAGRPWCSTCDCKRVVEGSLARADSQKFPCYESRLFREALFSSGPNRRIRHAGKGDIAFFTTRRPDERESQRRIIGAMRIATVNGRHAYLDGFIVRGDPASLIRLPEKHWLLYCKFVKSKSFESQGLFHYIADGEAERIVAAIRERGASVSVAFDLHSESAAKAGESKMHEIFVDKTLAAERSALSFKRNPELASFVKMRSRCEACKEAPEEKYGVSVLEAHHRTLFARLKPNTKVSIQDVEKHLAVLCPNCHRAIHKQSGRATVMPVERFSSCLRLE